MIQRLIKMLLHPSEEVENLLGIGKKILVVEREVMMKKGKIDMLAEYYCSKCVEEFESEEKAKDHFKVGCKEEEWKPWSDEEYCKILCEITLEDIT